MTERVEASVSVAEHPVSDELLPIREVVRQTGVNPVTLRAWERRYGLIRPYRTEGGHRLYTLEDIATIRDIMAWTERGLAVSKVGNLLARRREEAASASFTQAEPAASGESQQAEWQTRICQALQAFDEERLEQLYGQIFATFPLQMAFEEILLPVWRQGINDAGFGQLSQWLFYDAFLRSRVLQRMQMLKRDAQGDVLFVGIPDQHRELELLVSGLLVSGDTSRLRILPVGQPLEEVPVICQSIQPRALVVLAAMPPTQVQLRQLFKLALSVDCPMALAGLGAELAEAQLQGSPIANLGAHTGLMRDRLRQLIEGRLDT
ncbi:MerR family transcriptional regulator [Ectopseudomonas mendocina]|uniref:MerR family transcriptional regulator n=1 Tax=Ectopseudomonas mendocina TaxID=300 RepID=A0ABZ2RCP2_ECTME